MAEGDSMNFLQNVNTTDLLNMLAADGAESMTDIFPTSLADSTGMTVVLDVLFIYNHCQIRFIELFNVHFWALHVSSGSPLIPVFLH